MPAKRKLSYAQTECLRRSALGEVFSGRVGSRWHVWYTDRTPLMRSTVRALLDRGLVRVANGVVTPVEQEPESDSK